MRRWPVFLLGGLGLLVIAFSSWSALYAAIHDDPAETLLWGTGGILGGVLVYVIAESRATGQ